MNRNFQCFVSALSALSLLLLLTGCSSALIPAGSFPMGSATVTVSAFDMDTNLVTFGLWQNVYNWAVANGYDFDYPGNGKGANQPVQSVNWYDAVKWCNARSQRLGLTPVYYTDQGFSHVYTSGENDDVYAEWTAKGYRLPTEAEWVWAARGGLSGQRFPWGNTISETQANYEGHAWADDVPWDYGQGYNPVGQIGGYPYTSPVGSFPPNGYGLYDMAGNVEEWCWDWSGEIPYSPGSPYLGGTNPHGPASSPFWTRVLHGGDFYDGELAAQCDFGDWNNPPDANTSTGFRCVRTH